jgi:hypothetical protein
MAKPKNVQQADGFEIPDFDQWVETQGGFPPYWTPEEGKRFYAKPVMIDARDPKFVRYVFEALAPTECHRGATEEQEEVTVMPGEQFTCSAYAAMGMEFYLGIPVVVTTKEQQDSKSNPGHSYWNWSIKISPEHVPILQARQAEQAKLLTQSQSS